MSSNCKIFVPYRALGLVSNEVPLIIRYIHKRKEHFIVTVIGNTFHTYSSTKLGLLSVGNAHSSTIRCLSGDAFHVYTACDNMIYAWRRGTELKHKYVGHKDNVHLMLPFGPHLISIDHTNVLKIFDIKSEDLYLEMEFPNNFVISAVLHPATYINKILLGSKQGKLQLWDIQTNQLIYTLTGWNTEITVLEQAPALDVIAVGLSDGRIIVHNLEHDKTIVEFKQDWGQVTSISFRTDDAPMMVTGSLLGHIAIWDLMEKRLSSQIQDAHKGPVSGLQCLPNEPLLITSSSDNTLKMWIFDLSDGGARLLKFREGHSAPPLIARINGKASDSVVTAGEDSTIRIFSAVSDMLNHSLGAASYNRKAAKKSSILRDKLIMPPIVAFAAENTQEKPWDDVVAIHKGKLSVTTWSLKQQKMGEHKLAHKRFQKPSLRDTVATCVEITFCGNFAIIGYDSGHIDQFNIQSGIYRKSYGKPKAHEDSVRGVLSDGLNSFVISGDQSGILKWWNFGNCEILFKRRFNEGISKLHLNRDSGLLAIALDDWTIKIVDIDTRQIVRNFFGHCNEITDLTISPDSLWVISSSLDRSIRTWDLPSGMCVDRFLVPVPASSLSMSPTADFLATVHAGHLGVYLWANKKCFQNVNLCPVLEDFKPTIVPLPSTAVSENDVPVPESQEDAVEMEPEEEMEIEGVDYKSPEQISEDLITLALLPTSRWLNLLNLDVIKKRNKPIDPPKVAKSAPFFLPTVPGLDFKFADMNDDLSNNNPSKINSVVNFETLTKFGEALKQEKYDCALKVLLDIGPSAIELEIKGLDPDTGGSVALMLNFLNMIHYNLSKCQHYEAVQGYFSLFLKVHSDFIINNNNAQKICEDILRVHADAWHVIRKQFNQSLCLLSYFKNSAVTNY